MAHTLRLDPKQAPRIARIIDDAWWQQHRSEAGKVVCTSGGYDPIHPGHLSSIAEASTLGDSLVVMVNGDGFLRAKKGSPFQDLKTRCEIIRYVRGVDFVYPFEIEGDPTVIQALRKLRPAVFAKGGDRVDPATIPEWAVCEDLGIEVKTGIGLAKAWSSSDFLRSWGEFWVKQTDGRPRPC